MDGENERRDIDARVRAAVKPPADVVDRVVVRALADDCRPRQRWHPMRAGVMTVVALALLIGLTAAWQSRRHAGQRTLPTSLSITGEGSLLVVESQDGRRWLVGPVPERRLGGSYVIVVPK